jgi:hypothetical protein
MARLSTRTADLYASPVREMLNAALRPRVISFAGGLPASVTFAALRRGAKLTESRRHRDPYSFSRSSPRKRGPSSVQV